MLAKEKESSKEKQGSKKNSRREEGRPNSETPLTMKHDAFFFLFYKANSWKNPTSTDEHLLSPLNNILTNCLCQHH